MRLYIEGCEVAYSGSIIFKLQQADQLGELIGLVANDTVEVAATKELNTALGEVGYRFKRGDVSFDGVIEDDKGCLTRVVCTLQGTTYKRKQIQSYSFIIKTGNAAWFERLRNVRVMDVMTLNATPAFSDNWLKPDKDPESTGMLYAYAVGADNWRNRNYVRYDDGFRFIGAHSALFRGFDAIGLGFNSAVDGAFDPTTTVLLPVSKQWNGRAIEIDQSIIIEGTYTSGILSTWTVLTDNYASERTLGSAQVFRLAYQGLYEYKYYVNGVLQVANAFIQRGYNANDAAGFLPSYATFVEQEIRDSGDGLNFIATPGGFSSGDVIRIEVIPLEVVPRWNPNAYCDPVHFIPEQWTCADLLKGCASLFDLRIKTEGSEVTALPPLTSELLFGDMSEQFLKPTDGTVELDLMKDQKLTLSEVKKSTYLKYVDPEIPSYQQVSEANNWSVWAGLFGEDDTEFDTYETYKFVGSPNCFCNSVSPSGQPTTQLPSIVSSDNTDGYRPVIVDMVPMTAANVVSAIPLTRWSADFGATTTTKRIFRYFQFNPFTNDGMQLTFGSYESEPSLGEGLNRLKINQILDNRRLSARFGYWNGQPDVTVGVDSTTWNIVGGNYAPEKGSLNELTLLPVINTEPTDISKNTANNIFEFDPRDGYESEAQELSISGNDLSISGGNTITLPSGDPTMGGDLSGTASNAQIVANAVGTTEIADGAVTSAKILDGTITTADLAFSVDPLDLTTTNPAAPAANTVRVFRADMAEKQLIGFGGALQRNDFAQPHLANNHISMIVPMWSGANSFLGLPNLTTTNFTLQVAPFTNQPYTSIKRVRYGAIASLTTVCHWRSSTNTVFIASDALNSGGFFLQFWSGFTASELSTFRGFIGVRASATPTNVEPSTLTNCIGIGRIGAANENFQIFYGGSAAQTPINLGTDFALDVAGGDETMLKCTFYAPQIEQKVYYRIENLRNGAIAEGVLTGTVGTALPAATTELLAPWGYFVANHASVAFQYEAGVWYCEAL